MQIRLIEDDNTKYILWENRAHIWRGPLSVKQYCERNRRLYAHPFGQKIKTHGFFDHSGRIVSSLDVLPISLLIAEATKIAKKPCGLIANVLTPLPYRKHGYCTELLGHVLSSNTEWLLFSDIGPRFYEKFGFRAFPKERIIVAPIQYNVQHSYRLVSIDEFAMHLADTQTKSAQRKSKVSAAVTACVHPTVEWLDWHLERYRFFAECAMQSTAITGLNRNINAIGCYLVEHEDATTHPLLAVPNFVANQLEILWHYPNCVSCLEVGHDLSYANKFGSLAYWSDKKADLTSTSNAWPMLRSNAAKHLDCQYLDYW